MIKQILNDIDQNQAEIIAGLRKLIEMESSDGKATKAQEFVLKELKEMGFVFVKINGYKRDRDDHVKADDKSSLEWQGSIPYDYELDNYGSIEEYKQSILELINRIKSDKHSLILGGNVLC